MACLYIWLVLFIFPFELAVPAAAIPNRNYETSFHSRCEAPNAQ